MNRESPDYHNWVGQWVSWEVDRCVSPLVYKLAKDEAYRDAFFPPFYYPVRIYTFIYQCGCGNSWEVKGDDLPRGKIGSLKSRYIVNCSQCQEPNDCTDITRREADLETTYEYWVVSKGLAEKLEKKGEIILHSFLGLTVWSRRRTERAIRFDPVICEIYDEGPGKFVK